MRVINYTGTGQLQRSVLFALLTSKDVLKTVAPFWDHKTGMLRTKEANLIGGWAVRHYQKYDEPLGRKVFNYLERWTEKNKDKTAGQLVGKMVADIDAEFSSGHAVNTKFALDQIEAVFTEVRNDRLIEALQAEKERPSQEKDYQKILAEYSKPVSLSALAYQPMFDAAGLDEALSEQAQEILVEYPGAAGKFFGRDLCRGAFVSFVGPEKRGKTAWLVDLAFRATVQRRRVIFLSVGDLDIKATRRRFASRAARHPVQPDEAVYPTRLYQERGEETNKLVWKTDGKKKKWTERLTKEKAAEAWEKVKTEKIKMKEDNLMVMARPSSTYKASDVKRDILLLANQGWVPDVVVIDYADILAPEAGSSETRDQINMTWKILNGIRMEFDCLVVTATQADAASYNQEWILPNNFSEDKRKNAHVTGMIGINQFGSEKEYDVQRLNWVERREAASNVYRGLACAGCRSINNPCVLSEYPELGRSEGGVVEED